MLEKEVTDYVKAGCYEHNNNNRVDYRHGYYPRSLVTKLGKINRLIVLRIKKKMEGAQYIKNQFQQFS